MDLDAEIVRMRRRLDALEADVAALKAAPVGGPVGGEEQPPAPETVVTDDTTEASDGESVGGAEA